MAAASISAPIRQAAPLPRRALLELRAHELLLLALWALGLLLLRGPRTLWGWYACERRLQGADRLGPYLRRDIGVPTGVGSRPGRRIDCR